MDNPQLRLIELDGNFDYYVDEFSRVYRKLIHKPRGKYLENPRVICYNGRWFRELSPKFNKYWGLEIILNHGKRYHTSTHRLSALTFIPNPNNLPQVNHIDGNKHNNHISNLEWVDNTTNLQHAMRTGLRKTVDYLLVNILLGSSTYTQKEIADIVGCSVTVIEKYQSINKVQRPEHYSRYEKMNTSRAKLVGTKWCRNGGTS
jgi:hypothetical protein